jgi:two-component system, cell cycle sensor histidine kinase and response regulator CckA
MKYSRLSTPVCALLLAAVYLISGLLGNASSFMGGEVALVWPPAGIALAAVLIFGYRIWWGVAVGAWIFTFMRGSPFGFFTVATAIGNTVGALVCAYLLERFVAFENSMQRLRHAAGFILFACVLGTTVNAMFNVLGLCYSGKLPWDDLFSNVVIWWVPNAMGVLVVTPIILAWFCPGSVRPRPRMAVEAICCAIGLVVGTDLSFNSWFVNGVGSYPLAFLPYPFLVWAALRFGQRGATTGTMIVAGWSIYELLHGRGPFWSGNDQTSLLLIGCYIGVVAVGNLLLAATAVEREIAVRDTLESEKRYRGVVEDQTDLVCRFRPDGRLLFVNQAYCRFHGKSREQMIGTSFFPTLSEQDREIPMQEFRGLTPAEPIQAYDSKILLGNGKLVWQQCTVRALFDDAGRITEFQGVIQDITRRKESEEALRLGEERFRAILHSVVDGVIVLDATGAVTLFNPAAERVFGLLTAQVLNRPFRELLSPEDWPKYDDYLTHLGENPPKVIEVGAVRSSGGSLPIDLAVSEVVRGGVQMRIVIVRDISERKKLEDQYRQAQKMEAVGRLAGGIAHDFNNLMQAILGYSNLLDRRLAPGDPNHETVEHIQKSLAHASSLTSQLLAFSRKQVLKPKVVALNRIVGEMNHLLQRLLGETVRLEIELAQPVPWIRADPGQMDQLILNLAINARDAMAQGGTLGIRTANVTFAEPKAFSSGHLPPGDYALLSISDTGCGMGPEVQAHLFEPFFTTKETGKGTGLGLSNVYGVVKQSGGDITVTSAVGSGTTFHIYLPRFEAQPDEEESTQLTPMGHGGNETVLLVEDEELVRIMLVEVLKAAGYTVLDARHGDDALALAEQFEEPIDLLVTDMTMPGFSGSELARRLGEKRPAMRVLFISGYTDQETAQWDKLNQPVHYLQKPFHPDAFLIRARQILDRAKK